MIQTSARLLALLSLLQVRREWSGPDLADRLQVTERTVRRDVDKLRTLGYPIRSSPGASGGYQLGAGANLPPLLLDDDEALAVALGLNAVSISPVAGVGEASVRALAKLQQVAPPRLRGRFASLRDSVSALGGPSAHIDATVLTAITTAITDRRVLPFDHVGRDETPTRRLVEPYRLIDAGRRWYLVGFDLDRDDWRTFRVDRIERTGTPRARFAPRPLPAADLTDYVQQTITRSPYRYDLCVRIGAPVERVTELLGPLVAQVEAEDGGSTLVKVGADSLDWALAQLIGTGEPFTLLSPPELLERARELAGRLASAATESRPSSPSSPVPPDAART
ncbi:YafY family protein [Tersicoccus sp. MR15.9]|uniref:helix-turn-helix transcriptional regulator n=1 Tax=Tersicoccus mangrovi TaxID=3121635 RepID=UPI002FE5D90D